jgi:hypothetical protein
MLLAKGTCGMPTAFYNIEINGDLKRCEELQSALRPLTRREAGQPRKGK